jgi:hypothetical protein
MIIRLTTNHFAAYGSVVAGQTLGKRFGVKNIDDNTEAAHENAVRRHRRQLYRWYEPVKHPPS